MNDTPKPTYRKRRLFPRGLGEVVKAATQPLMDKQGKLYGALLRDWASIVGPTRAAVTKPQRLQFSSNEASGAVLHLEVRPAAAPALAYETAEMLEQCARHFGYRAIERIVLHPTHGVFADAAIPEKTEAPKTLNITSIPASMPTEMRGVLERLAQQVAKSDLPK
ncbi:MAG: DciA family protein [Rickettsiales bacterium]